MIVKLTLFSICLSKEGSTDHYIFVEAENIEEALQVANKVVDSYYRDRKITAISSEQLCFRYE